MKTKRAGVYGIGNLDAEGSGAGVSGPTGACVGGREGSPLLPGSTYHLLNRDNRKCQEKNSYRGQWEEKGHDAFSNLDLRTKVIINLMFGVILITQSFQNDGSPSRMGVALQDTAC